MKAVITYKPLFTLLLCFLQVAGLGLSAQNTSLPKARQHRMGTTIGLADSLVLDSLQLKERMQILETAEPPKLQTDKQPLLKKDSVAPTPVPVKELWLPNPTKAVWLATVIPGGGQIYNRKYWKLPIIYGGFVGCAYALSWNGKYYKDYSRAYQDIMSGDPNRDSYLDFLPPNYNVEGDKSRLQTVFKNKKDFYRRNRDLSIFAFIGVYLLSIVDAYVDAELSTFDISSELGFRVEPAVINDPRAKTNSLGLQCSIKF